MTKRTRLFLMAAAGILVVGLGTGLVASYVGVQNLLIIGGNGPSELSYVPASARLIAYANVRDVMDSEVRRKLSALHPNAPDGPNEFKEQTGIDIETDIDYVLAAAFEPAGADVTDGPPLVLARGRFDAARIEGLARDKGGSVVEHNGVRLLVDESMRFAVAFVEPDLVALGMPGSVRTAIDTKASGADVTGNAELMQLIRDIDQGDAWAVAKFDALSGSQLPAELAQQLPSIDWFSASGVINSGVQGQLRVEARDEAAAQNLQDVIRGFMALARLQGGQHPQVNELLNSLQLAGQGTTVSLSFSLPPEVIDAIGALRAARPPRAPDVPRPPEPPAPPSL
jgi:hypothetical protein